MKKSIVLFAWLIGFYAHAQSIQTTIRGVVYTPDGKPIANVTVVLKDSSNLIRHFTRSDESGRFSFPLPESQLKKISLIEAYHIGHEKKTEQVMPGLEVYNFHLPAAYRELPAVKVKNRPVIISKGDTLSYQVKSFAKQEDRSIGDVIKRMPGLTVDDEGKIYYNNKQVDNLYTDGDNLMDGRYGLATRIITKDMIESVDVIQNHQPVEVLRGKVASDKVSLNLVLKNDRKTSVATQVVAGAGLPGQYDGTLSVILLKKKIKFLNALRANNSGGDYRGDFSQLGSTSMLDNISATNPDVLLSPGTVSTPDLPRRNYYLNRSAVLNINQLFKNKKDVQYRANLQAFTDRQQMRYEGITTLRLNGSSATYREQQRAVGTHRVVQAAFSWMANRSTYFASNKITVQLQRDQNESALSTNNISFAQRLSGHKYTIANDLSLVPALMNRAVLELRWLLHAGNNPQRLRIDTGLHAGIVNQDVPYRSLLQRAAVPTFFSHLSAAYLLPQKTIQQNYQAGLITERQHLNSLLLLEQNDGSTGQYERDAGNALEWQRDRFFLQATYSYQRPRYELSLAVPFILQRIGYRQYEYDLNERLQQVLINPSARMKWTLNREDYLVFNYGYTNNPGNITGVYRGTVLTNYRSLQASDAALQQVNRTNAGAYYHFQRSVMMLFMSAGWQYNRSTANFMLSSIITDSIQRVILLPYRNTQENFNISASFSKYLFSLGGTFSLKALYQRGRSNQLVNSVLLPYDNAALSFTSSWQGRLFKRISFNYEGFFMNSNSYPKGSRDAGVNMFRMDQQTGVNFSLVTGVVLQARARHLYTKQTGVNPVSYVFADMNLRYSVLKWRTDFELDGSNLLGIKTYELYRLNANIASRDVYHIRGRMLLLRATFNL